MEGSSVNMVKRLEVRKLREIRYQASTSGFSLVKILLIGTEDHIDFFSMAPAGKAAGN